MVKSKNMILTPMQSENIHIPITYIYCIFQPAFVCYQDQANIRVSLSKHKIQAYPLVVYQRLSLAVELRPELPTFELRWTISNNYWILENLVFKFILS